MKNGPNWVYRLQAPTNYCSDSSLSTSPWAVLVGLEPDFLLKSSFAYLYYRACENLHHSFKTYFEPIVFSYDLSRLRLETAPLFFLRKNSSRSIAGSPLCKPIVIEFCKFCAKKQLVRIALQNCLTFPRIQTNSRQFLEFAKCVCLIEK